MNKETKRKIPIYMYKCEKKRLKQNKEEEEEERAKHQEYTE